MVASHQRGIIPVSAPGQGKPLNFKGIRPNVHMYQVKHSQGFGRVNPGKEIIKISREFTMNLNSEVYIPTACPQARLVIRSKYLPGQHLDIGIILSENLGTVMIIFDICIAGAISNQTT